MTYLTKKCAFTASRKLKRNPHIHRYNFESNIKFVIRDGFDFAVIDKINLWIKQFMSNALIINPGNAEWVDNVDFEHKWYMSLNGEHQYCEPTTLNISKEIFIAMDVLFANEPNIQICEMSTWVDNDYALTCNSDSISDRERDNFLRTNKMHLELFRDENI